MTSTSDEPARRRLSAQMTVELVADADDRADRHALTDLWLVPDGAQLVVKVADRERLGHSAVSVLAQQAERLHVRIEATTPAAAHRWITALANYQAPAVAAAIDVWAEA